MNHLIKYKIFELNSFIKDFGYYFFDTIEDLVLELLDNDFGVEVKKTTFRPEEYKHRVNDMDAVLICIKKPKSNTNDVIPFLSRLLLFCEQLGPEGCGLVYDMSPLPPYPRYE